MDYLRHALNRTELRWRKFVHARLGRIRLCSKSNRQRRVYHPSFVHPGVVRLAVLQHWPAIGDLNAPEIAQGRRLARPGKSRFTVQKLSPHAPCEFLTHLNVQTLI